MSIVEHNDVDVRPLFFWKKDFEIIEESVDGEGKPVLNKIPVYMRLLGDADINRSRVSALRSSADLRRKLRDLDSDERMAFIKDIDDMDENLIVSAIIVFSMRDLTKKADDKVKIKIPKSPRSDAKTEAHEKYQADIDSYPERRRQELRDILSKDVDKLKNDLLKKDKQYLYNEYVKLMVDEMCEQEILKRFKEMCVYFGSFSDPELKTKFFESFEEFDNLSPELKQDFIREYSSLELYGEELKKLRQVTP